MAEHRRPLGETLIEAGVLTPAQLQTALTLQEKRQIRLGTILLQEGIVSEPQLVQALSRQLSIPWVSLWHIDIPDQLLKLVPVNLAEEFFLIPIYVRSSPKGDKILYVAMNDPTDESALRFVSAAAGMVVRPMIAGPSDIAAAIRAYYYGEEPSIPADDSIKKPAAPPPVKPPPPKPPVPAVRSKLKEKETIEEFPQDFIEEWESGVHQLSDVEAHLNKKRAELEAREQAIREKEISNQPAQTTQQPAVADDITPPPNQTRPSKSPPQLSATPESSAHVAHQRQVERHMFGVGHQGATKPKALSLTLLDGTTLSFGKPRKEPEKQVSRLGAEEFLKILRTSAEELPSKGALPSEKWEDHLAALLDVLFRKHLVSYEEYLESLQKK